MSNKDKSINCAKELIKKLIDNTLNVPLLKLETNSSSQLASLKITNKSYNEFLKLINNLNKNFEETKKKKLKDKEKERKSQYFKRGRKMVTENNLSSRSKTIESNLMKFRNRIINIDGKKNTSKMKKNSNINFHKEGNRTMSSFRNINEIEKDKETASHKINRFKNMSFLNTSQNFRKTNSKILPTTPMAKIREKEKNIILEKAMKSKKIDYRNTKNYHSRTLILSHLTDIDEKAEKNMNNDNNQKKKVNNKDIKKIIYRNDNKSKNNVVRLNYNTERVKVKEMKMNDENNINNTQENINKNIIIKEMNDININKSACINSNQKDNIKQTNELRNIVKLVDDVNENLTKLLRDNQKTRRRSVKEIKLKNQEMNSLLNAIKDVKIKDLHNNSLENINQRLIEKYELLGNNDKNDFKDNKININKSFSLNDFHIKNKFNNINNIKNNEKNKFQSLKDMHNYIINIKLQISKKIIRNRNKSLNLKKYNSNDKIVVNEPKSKKYKSLKNVFENIKKDNEKEKD